MPDTIGRPGGLMFSHWASMMKLSGLELGQVDTTRLGILWTFGIVVECCGTRIERNKLQDIILQIRL